MASKVSPRCLLFQTKLVIISFSFGNRLDGGCKGMDWNKYKNSGKTFILTILIWPIKEMGQSDHLLRDSDTDVKVGL